MHNTSAAPAAAPRTTLPTRTLLTCGVIAGPLFVVAALLQAFTRDGFDLKRHPFSMLSLGELGWIQIANFVIAGLLFIACAVGMRRAWVQNSILTPCRAELGDRC